jgi:hypothetical protein
MENLLLTGFKSFASKLKTSERNNDEVTLSLNFAELPPFRLQYSTVRGLLYEQYCDNIGVLQ